MATIHLTIPDDLNAWAEAQVSEGVYASPDALVAAALAQAREDERRRTWLAQSIADGDGSGTPISAEDVYEHLWRKHGFSSA